MTDYTRELLALRYDSRLMRQLSTLNDGLLRNVLSIVAHARCLCPNIVPSVAVSVHPSSVTLLWKWDRCQLTVVVPECQNPFDDPMSDEEVEAFFTDRSTGELWRATGFYRLGSGTMSPIFPPQVAQKLLEAHTSSAVYGAPRRGGVYINSFRFKRLFPDLRAHVIDNDDDAGEYRQDEQSTRQSGKDRLWRRFVESVTPVFEAFGAGIGRYLFEEAIPRIIQRRRQAQHD